MKFGIGVILYNPDIAVIDRLKEYNDLTNNLIIFDNSVSTNEISEEISDNFKYYHRNSSNVGMSGALNYIFNKAMELELDILLSMDQDSDFLNVKIKSMLNIMSKDVSDEVAIYCPNYRKLYTDVKSGVEVKSNLKINSNVNKNVNSCMTSGSFYRMKMLKNIGKLDNLFIGYVDQDICYNLISKGYKIQMIGGISFNQRVGKPVESNFKNRLLRVIRHTNDRYYYMIRNNLYLQKKYMNNREITSELRRGMLRILLNIVIGEKEKNEKIKACIKGRRDFKNNTMGKKLLEED